MGLRDDKLVESPKLLEDTKDPMHASTSHHVWAAFCSTWSARAQCVHLHHWWPLVENSALHGRLRVSESRVWRVAPAAQISAAPKGSSSFVCVAEGEGSQGRVCIVFYLKLLLLEISIMPHIS